jgi:DNA-directed RNA polymerase specialized sigma24 family protein
MVTKKDSHKKALTEKGFTDRELLERVFTKRLRAYAEKLFAGKTYGGLGPEDLVQSTYTRVVNEAEWRGQTERSLIGRLCTTMLHDFFDLKRKYGPDRHTDLLEAMDIKRSGKRIEKAQTDAERESYTRLLKSLFPGDTEMHMYIDLWLKDYTAPEMAEEMGLEEHQVINLRNRFLEKIKSRVKKEMISGY